LKILITGGAGFIGTNCISYFKKKGHEIINVDKLGIGSVKKNLLVTDVIFYKLDISKKFPEKLIEEVDLLVNFASESHVDRSIKYPLYFFKNNLGLQMNILEALRKSEKELKMVHISTDEVYGDILEGSFTEESTLRPSSPYSASKAAQDMLALSYARTYGLNISITRCTNNYGPFQLPEKLIPKSTILAKRNLKIPIYGNGRQIRDWIFVEDHCTAIETVAEKGKKGEVYNVAGGNELSNIDVVTRILDLLGRPKKLIDFVKDRPGHDVRYSINSKKIKEIGWNPKVKFEKALKKTVQWYLENENWWTDFIKFG
jgi:dTDP-glucose 4,6-dehydratase